MFKKLNRIYVVLKWNLYEKWRIKPLSKKAFKNLHNKSFSIFANNCAAGFIYQDSGLPYLTPTIGLFFYSPCYIKILQNFHWINQPIRFVSKSKYEKANLLRETNNDFYPIGIIGDNAEIHFLHYKSDQEAQEKWTRRLAKLNYDNLLIMYSVRDLATDEHVEEFCKLPFKNKLCITSKAYPELKEVMQLKMYRKKIELPAANHARINILRKINITEILNKIN
jgi:uncharacterized protein (DUF1919 family)